MKPEIITGIPCLRQLLATLWLSVALPCLACLPSPLPSPKTISRIADKAYLDLGRRGVDERDARVRLIGNSSEMDGWTAK